MVVDIILCKDQVSGEFVEPFGFENYVLGDVMRPFNVEKYKWYAVMVLTPNLTLRDACEPLGGMIMKERQLKTIGYTPVLVSSRNMYIQITVNCIQYFNTVKIAVVGNS